MAKERRTVVQGGRLWMAVQYTSAYDRDPYKRRQQKCLVSSPAREKLNAVYSWQKLLLLLAANFQASDLAVELGYRDEVRPKRREDADRILSNFIRQLRKKRREAGKDLVYVRVTEGYHSGGKLHHHLVINATGQDFQLIRSLWARWGDNIDFTPFGEDGAVRWSDYLTKEPITQGRKHVGDRTWRISQNAIRPKRRSSFVSATEKLQPPPGAFVIETDEKTNCYGRFVYLKAIIKDDEKQTTEYPEI